MSENDIIVICNTCFTPCPSHIPTDGSPFRAYRWHEPCPNCGAEDWAAHETNRDPRTGIILK
jgi:hypothetical protein